MDLTQLNQQQLAMTLDVLSSLPAEDRFERLLTMVREILPCDAAALLRYRKNVFIPMATNGLKRQVRSMQFPAAQHPRLSALLHSEAPIRFDMDSDLPDPYDGLVSGEDGLPDVHDCIGIPLRQNNRLIGALTLDSIEPRFDGITDEQLRTVSELASVAMDAAVRMADLEQKAASAADKLWKEFSGLPLREATDAFQHRLLELALEDSDKNWSAAARKLGIDNGNLHRLAKRLGMKD